MVMDYCFLTSTCRLNDLTLFNEITLQDIQLIIDTYKQRKIQI